MSNTDTNQASEVKRNSLNKSDEDVKLELMSNQASEDAKTAKQAIMDYFGVTLVPESLLKEIEAIHQQEIAKAKEQVLNNIIEYVQVNQKGQFEEDSTGSVCWYLDDLVEALKEPKAEL